MCIMKNPPICASLPFFPTTHRVATHPKGFQCHPQPKRHNTTIHCAYRTTDNSILLRFQNHLGTYAQVCDVDVPASFPPQHLSYFIYVVLPCLCRHHAHATVIFVLVMRTDPASSHKLLCNLHTAGQASCDIAAHPPWVVDAVEGME